MGIPNEDVDAGRIQNPSYEAVTGPFEVWRRAFGEYLERQPVGAVLKAAALAGDLRTWTNELTTPVVRTCERLSWQAAAKWNPCCRLPKGGQEYLSIDVMAFPSEAQQAGRCPATRSKCCKNSTQCKPFSDSCRASVYTLPAGVIPPRT